MTRQSLQDEVLGIVAATGATVFFVTHDLEEAVYLGDRVIGLRPHPGRIGIEEQVPLPRPRDQLTTREQPAFLRLRRTLFDFTKSAKA
jgi:NitT/TauT family transport system ATP-binding protein